MINDCSGNLCVPMLLSLRTVEISRQQKLREAAKKRAAATAAAEEGNADAKGWNTQVSKVDEQEKERRKLVRQRIAQYGTKLR